jgi:hypothetical protein
MKSTMTLKNITFIDNSGAKNGFIKVHLDSQAVLKSWRKSVYSYEWLDSNGVIKPLELLKPSEYDKRKSVESSIQEGHPLTTPILGIGIMDNIEIGSARAEILTCIDLGYEIIPAHIPQSQEKEFKKFLARQPKIETGSVLFYILIAVALLAALSFTIAKSTQGEVSGMNEEQAGLIGAEIITAAGFIAETTSKLRLEGCAENQISFETPQIAGLNVNNNAPPDKSCHIFDVNGGGLNYVKLEDKAGESASWAFTGEVEVTNIGSTCGNDECDDLLLFATNLHKTVCERINKHIGINGVPSINLGFTQFDDFEGTFTYAGTIDDADLNGKISGCLLDTFDNKYYFYRVLDSR